MFTVADFVFTWPFPDYSVPRSTGRLPTRKRNGNSAPSRLTILMYAEQLNRMA